MHIAIEMNRNIHIYWLPGKYLSTIYEAFVVRINIISPDINPVLDFLYPNTIPNIAINITAKPK